MADIPLLIQSMTSMQNRRCSGDGCADSDTGKSRMSDHPLCCADDGGCKSTGRDQKQIHIPLVADIHFDYKLAIAAMENGADKIRINPGNIGKPGTHPGCG